MSDNQSARPHAPALGLPTLPESGVLAGALADSEVDTLHLGQYEGEGAVAKLPAELPKAAREALDNLANLGDFKGKPGEVAVAYPTGAGSLKRIVLTGLGKREKLDCEAVRTASAHATRRSQALGGKRVATAVLGGDGPELSSEIAAQATLEGALLAAYRFGGWKNGGEEAPRIDSVELLASSDENSDRLNSAAKAARAVARGVAVARDLVNLPGNVASADYIATAARKLAAEKGLSFTLRDRAWMESEGMGALLAVARGSRSEPAMIELSHNQERTDLPLVVLVGKGVTFDSGGLSLKSGGGMVGMKGDMAGAAAVIGALAVVGELNLPVRVMGVCGFVENMPDGNAFRPSDVLVAGSGRSIEVISTDAEGRLVLADLLWYVQRLKPAAVVNIATLTGASARALGVASSLFTNDADLGGRLEAASKNTHDRVWPMPLFEEYREMIKSPVADLKNTGGATAGASTAAAFLEAFVDYPWAHIDMAGMEASSGTPKKPYLSEGATGYGVRLFVEYLRQLGE